jgi:lysophospholipase L1-like esterase
MYTPDGMPNHELFQEDGLHMNKKGYTIWRNVLLSHASKIFL